MDTLISTDIQVMRCFVLKCRAMLINGGNIACKAQP